MAENYTHIEALDCLPFKSTFATAEVLQTFIETQSNNVFYFTGNKKYIDYSPLAEFDYLTYQWKAGRFIGEAFFQDANTDYKITIKPRFGEKVLFRMLEEIFNIRITKSLSGQKKDQDWQHYIKKIIAFIWLQKLANANIHGLPKKHIKTENIGFTIKGKLDVRKSIRPIFQSGMAVSINREKQIDETIAQIILTAYKILQNDFPVGRSEISESAQEAINHFSSASIKFKFIEERDYKGIRYKEIYQSWKPIVDFSWEIIKRKRISLKQEKTEKNGFGFFIDMAEVWEQYLRSILIKGLLPYGWRIRKEKIIAYKKLFFERELIPDFVFQRDQEIVVWDAKYKRMVHRSKDVDREDFFQIHTYLQHFIRSKNVKAGGLLYPILEGLTLENNTSPFLLNEEGLHITFSIDGVELSEVLDGSIEVADSNQLINEKKFIARILQRISGIGK
jgi:5-methylcytosine-specific restriction endonuclease McrBC regulatory subunit McrC